MSNHKPSGRRSRADRRAGKLAKKPIKTQSQTAHENQCAREENPKANILPSNPPNINPTPYDALESNAQEGESDKPFISKRNREKLELFAITIALVVAVVSVFQSCFTFRQARSAERQLKEMHKQLIIDQRAWVNVFSIARTDFANPTVRFEAHFKNTGKTPAINTRAEMGVTTNINLVTSHISPPNSSQQILPPDVESQVQCFFPIPDTERTNILSGKEAVYVYGTIWYDDIFTNQHWSRFCWVVDAARNVIYPAMTNNSSDDAEGNNKR